MTSSSNAYEVEQCDREAAAAYITKDTHNVLGGEHHLAIAIREGKVDELWIVQAFAKHRHKQTSALREALEALDAVLDFEEPGSDEKPWIFEDWSDLNKAFELARLALRTGGVDNG